MQDRFQECLDPAAALRLVARGLQTATPRWGAFLPREKLHLGAPKAITATAHKLARLVYAMLKYGTQYVEVGEEEYERRYRQRVVVNLRRKARALGFTLVQIPMPAMSLVTMED